MPSNAVLYPIDFPQSLPGNQQSTSIDDAISLIHVQSRDAALKQSLSNRLLGQMSIDDQNRLITAVQRLMPLDQVGKTPVPSTAAGIAAYFGGGRGDAASDHGRLNRLLFSNETMSTSGIRLVVPRTYMGTVSNAEAGRFAGGAGGPNSTIWDAIEKFSYLEERIALTAAKLSLPRFTIAGGIGNKLNGYLLGGVYRDVSTTKRVDRITYTTDTCVSIGDKLQVARLAPHNGTCNPFNGYLFAGAGQWVATNPIFNIERFTLATETTIALAATLAYAYVSHGTCTSSTRAYIAGGCGVAETYNDIISTFAYLGETVAILSNRLAEPKICCDGTGSSLAGYIAGGDTPTSGWVGSASVDKLPYSTEAIARLSATLDDTLADQGVIADWSPAL